MKRCLENEVKVAYQKIVNLTVKTHQKQSVA